MGPIVLYLNYFFLIPDEVNVHATVYISNTATCKKKKDTHHRPVQFDILAMWGFPSVRLEYEVWFSYLVLFSSSCLVSLGAHLLIITITNLQIRGSSIIWCIFGYINKQIQKQTYFSKQFIVNNIITKPHCGAKAYLMHHKELSKGIWIKVKFQVKTKRQ